jgi:folate-binding protein YgfZ
MAPRNYADPAGEYAAARTGAVIITRDDRALLRMYGRDPLRIIQGIVTNDVAGAAPDRVVYAALLTAKGRMLADVRVIRRGAELLLDVPAAALTQLLEVFRKTIPPLFARFEDVTAGYVMHGVYGPEASTVLRSVIATAYEPSALPSRDGFMEAVWGSEIPVLIMTTEDAGPGGADVLVPVDAADAFADAGVAAGAVRAGTATYDVLRIEAGSPMWGRELDETIIPLEADLLARAISTNKGCYTGQEVIIRVLHRGHVNWHLRGFLLGGAPTPPAGAQLVRPGESKQVARITSAAYSPRFGQTIALGYARREIEPETDLALGDGTIARVVSLPFVREHSTSDAT